MKKASLIIQDIQNNVYNDTFLDIYVDQEQLEHQKLRYVQSISLIYMVIRKSAFIAHLEEAKFVGIILIINMVKF